MRTCPYCGGPVSDNANFCQKCGSDIREILAEDLYIEDKVEESGPYADTESYADSERYVDTERDADSDEYAEPGEYTEAYGDTEPAKSFFVTPGDFEPASEHKQNSGQRQRSYYETEKVYNTEADDDDEKDDGEAKKTLTVGVVLAALICVLGIGLYFVVSNMLKQQPEIDVGTGLNNKPVQVTTVPEKEQEKLQKKDTQEEVSEEVDSEENPEEDSLEIQATVTGTDPGQFPQYQRAGIVSTQASSVLEDDGRYHVSDYMVDGNPGSSWQEGSAGDGIGEWAYVQLDRAYSIRYLTFMLGNWASSDLYIKNNRPSRLLVKLDNREFYLDFPDEMRSYTVELSDDCQASEILVQVLDVYSGSKWSDCCIAEMSVYGR